MISLRALFNSFIRVKTLLNILKLVFTKLVNNEEVQGTIVSLTYRIY